MFIILLLFVLLPSSPIHSLLSLVIVFDHMLGGAKAEEEVTDGRCITRRYSISCILALQLLLSLCCGIVQCREDTVLAQARGFFQICHI